jgi:hypothetical protein
VGNFLYHWWQYFVDGRLQAGHGLEGGEKEHEGEGDDHDVLQDEEPLVFRLERIELQLKFNKVIVVRFQRPVFKGG